MFFSFYSTAPVQSSWPPVQPPPVVPILCSIPIVLNGILDASSIASSFVFSMAFKSPMFLVPCSASSKVFVRTTSLADSMDSVSFLVPIIPLQLCSSSLHLTYVISSKKGSVPFFYIKSKIDYLSISQIVHISAC